MQEDYGVYENEDENLLGEEELTEDEERDLEDDRGVTELNEAYDEAVEEAEFYNGFPELDDIYNEKYVEDNVPNGLTEEQSDYYKRGIEAVDQINKKYNCNLTFNGIVGSLNKFEENYMKNPLKNKGNINTVMSNQLFDMAEQLAIKMQESKVYSTNFSKRQIKNNLLSSFKEISKAVRLYAKIYPEKFAGVGRNGAFKENGQIRSVFKPKIEYINNGVRSGIYQKFDAKALAEGLRTKAIKTGGSYFRNYHSPLEAKLH